ncbi:class I SAM-dependent methyltransferase [Actinomadura vinacea]|uniref:Class I SAM-dependent methyltransferase n=1 Tax=Actinomadura vinacea TaxID=115336 RepID=A0ABN3JVL9_9ACTN
MHANGTVQERILDLLDPAAAPTPAEGYLDLIGPEDEPEPSFAQRVMESTFLPHVYERFWRPAVFSLAKGWPIGPDAAQEHALARTWLGLGARKPDATVLDVACGPGNVTRGLAAGVGADGLVVGLDLAAGMLARAAADTTDPHVGYVRGNAVDLPFRDGSFDAVCCFGALYLFEDPWGALDGMVRVLKPGGRMVILTSRRPPLPLSRLGARALTEITGFRLFGDGEVTGFLRRRRLGEIKQRRYPGLQLVGVRKPGPG